MVGRDIEALTEKVAKKRCILEERPYWIYEGSGGGAVFLPLAFTAGCPGPSD
jgi:hypothetical protein